MIVALIGTEQFSKDFRIEKFWDESLGDMKDNPLARQIIFVTEENKSEVTAQVIECCGTVSMFAPEQAVVVRNADVLKTEDTKILADWLKDAPDCKLLLDFDKLASNTTLYKTIAKVGKIETYEEPRQYKMQEWIANTIPSFFNVGIDSQASQYLADALGTNTKIVGEEVKKILQYQPDTKKITYDLVKMLVAPQREIPPYELFKYFGLLDAPSFTKKLHEILYFEGKSDPSIPLLAGLYGYAVDLLNFMSLTAKKMDEKTACQTIGQNYYTFCMLGKASECCRRWNKVRLCRVIRRLADLNYEFKCTSWSTTNLELALAALVVR